MLRRGKKNLINNLTTHRPKYWHNEICTKNDAYPPDRASIYNSEKEDIHTKK